LNVLIGKGKLSGGILWGVLRRGENFYKNHKKYLGKCAVVKVLGIG